VKTTHTLRFTAEEWRALAAAARVAEIQYTTDANRFAGAERVRNHFKELAKEIGRLARAIELTGGFT
jgi:hypothetical protein